MAGNWKFESASLEGRVMQTISSSPGRPPPISVVTVFARITTPTQRQPAPEARPAEPSPASARSEMVIPVRHSRTRLSAAHALWPRSFADRPDAAAPAPPWRAESAAASPPRRDHPKFSRWPDFVRGTVPSCNCRSRSAAPRSSRSANAKRMRSVLPDPEVEMLAARLQNAAFLRSSCTRATISFSGLGGSKRGGMLP